MSQSLTPSLPGQEEPSPRAKLPRVVSRDLLQGGRRLIIEHEGEAYCLRLTRKEKLILTKN